MPEWITDNKWNHIIPVGRCSRCGRLEYPDIEDHKLITLMAVIKERDSEIRRLKADAANLRSLEKL